MKLMKEHEGGIDKRPPSCSFMSFMSICFWFCYMEPTM